MQNPNPSGPPPFMLLVEANIRKEMRDEQTRQEGLGQPTVLEGLMGAASAPTPQTNVAGMPQDVASNMGQNMAPKTDVPQNTGIASVAPVATMASGGILKMQEGGDPAKKTYTFVYPEDMNTPSFKIKPSDGIFELMVETFRKLGGTIVETDTNRVMQSDTAKEILQESSDVAEADARVSKYVPSASDLYATEAGRFKSENATPENYVVSAGLPPAGGAMYSSPTGARGGSTDSSGLGLPTGEFSEVPLSAIPRPKGLATLGAAGDADMRGETPVVNTTSLTETQRRIKESDAKRARAAFLESLAPNNAQGQPGGTVGGFRGLDAIISRSPNSGELTPTQTARNQEMFEGTLRREEVARQRADIAEAGKIAQDAADTREAYSVPLESDAVKTVSAGETKPNPFAVSKAPFNATSDEAAKESVSQARVTADEPGTELAETAGRPASNAQLEAFTDAAALRNTALTVPTKPEVFDPLKGLFTYQALADDPPTDDKNYDAKTIIKRINELKTPEEKAATLTMLNNRFIDAEQKVESLKERLQRARIAEQSGTGDYNYDVEAGVGRFGAGELAATLKKELIAAKDDFNLLYKNIGGLVPASGFGGNFATERYFGKDTVSALNKLKTDDLQAEAAADVAKVTANKNYPVSPVEVRKRLRAMEEKDADADERFDLAEARLDAERAAGLTAGEDAFVAPSKKEPYVPPYGSKFAKNSAFSNDEADYDGSSTNSLDIDGPFMGGEDTRITRMKVLADKISSGELTPTALEYAKKDLARLSAAVERTGGQDTIEKYFSNQIIGPALRGAEKYGVKGIDFAVNELGLGSLASQAVSPEFAGRISDYTRKNAKLADSMQVAADTSPAEIQSNAILDAMITNDAQIKAGSAANVDNSLGALITDGKAQIGAVPGPLLTPELNNKLAAELATTLENRTEEISGKGALINKMWGESKFQPGTNVESQIVNAEGLTAAEQLDADRAAGLTAGENAFVATTNQDAGGGGKDKPKGIATINPMANRASDSPSSYEQKLLDILAEREKSADQDKWLGLAEMGMRLMASSNPNMLSAIGEAGLGASQTFLGNKRKAEAQEMDILTKLSALESRKQIADDANRTRLEAAGIAAGARSGKPAAGSYASVNTALTGIRAQISAIEGNMPAQPPTDSRELDAYNTQIATLRSLREQEQQLMATNPVVASIFANVDGAKAPAAVNLSK